MNNQASRGPWSSSACWLLYALLSSSCAGDAQGSNDRPERIIMVSMDTVRADHVSGYGELHTTPRLASIADEGLRFEDFYGASTYTIPSTMSIMTGLDPAEHFMDAVATRISPSVPMLAELLLDAGYLTQAFHEGGYVAGRFGFERGFIEYREFGRVELVQKGVPEITDWMRNHADSPYFLFIQTYAAHFPFGGMQRYREQHPERGLPDAESLASLRDSVQAGSKVLREQRRFYGLCNYFADGSEDQIGPYISVFKDFPSTANFDLDVEQIKRSYDERIGLIDAALGQVQDTLKDLGQWENTLFVVFSDHGEAFFEHGLERHDYVPFNECLKLPLVISYPALLKDRQEHVVEGLAWHLDLMPTVLSLACVAAPAGLQGQDLTPILRDSAAIDPQRMIFPAVLRPAFRSRLPLRRVVIQGDHKWIQGHEHFGDPDGFLFNLAEDPEERHNLRESQSERFSQLASEAQLYASKLQRRAPVHQQTGLEVQGDGRLETLELNQEQEDDLKGLGYAGEEED